MKRFAVLLAMVTVTALVVGSLGGEDRPRAEAQETPPVVIQRAKTSYAPPASAKTPLTILAIGSDFRVGEPGCGCADSLHLITVNPTKRKATILGFPRDSWMNIPGYGHGKINTALQLGGPELVVRAVQDVTGIGIDYYALADFEGFSRMIDGVGGITVDVPYPMNDPYSGAVFDAGPTRMKGGHALAFSRNRYGTPGGDLGRSENQGRVFLGALAELRKDFQHDPAALVGWIAVASRYLATDLTLGELTRLALAGARVKPSDVDNLIVPSTIGNVGAASVVFISSGADAVFADLRDDGILDD